jgi:hypothetical protein
MTYGIEYDDYAYSGNEGRISDDYTPYYPDSYDYEPNQDMSVDDWHVNPSGGKCPWCKDGLSSPFEPEDQEDAEMYLCTGHAAEYAGLSIDALNLERDNAAFDQL